MYPVTYKWGGDHAVKLGAEFRSGITDLERTMFEANGGGDGLEDFPVDHHFAPQVYGRKMLIPAGGTITGKIHRHAHLNVILSGRAIVATEFGREEVCAGMVFVSQPGTKRAVRAIEDTVWLTIHPNASDTQDLAEIENYVIAAPTYSELGCDMAELIEVSR